MTDRIVPIVVVHGGAGNVPPESREAHLDGCRRAAATGLEALIAGHDPLEAAIRAVELMEDDLLFNAGTGGSLCADGTLELDAAVMEGTGRTGGGVCVLPPFTHPIRIAEAVRREGRHVLYAGPGAAAFARGAGFEPAAPERMITDRARDRLRRHLAGEVGQGWAGGTVGAVACDAEGRVAAATSTGGTVGKAPGRVGDTPLLGAGTYADDASGACSATGIGETIMRACLARAVTDALATGDTLPAVTAQRVLDTFAARFEGSGGFIGVDPRGRPCAVWNTPTMSHAIAREGEPVQTGGSGPYGRPRSG